MTQHSWYGDARKRWEYFAAIGSISMARRCILNVQSLAHKYNLSALEQTAHNAALALYHVETTAESTTTSIKKDYKKG